MDCVPTFAGACSSNEPNVSESKIKEGIFIRPKIRELMQGTQFDEDLNETERNALLSFKRIYI
jgi:hypothetical protein